MFYNKVLVAVTSTIFAAGNSGPFFPFLADISTMVKEVCGGQQVPTVHRMLHMHLLAWHTVRLDAADQHNEWLNAGIPIDLAQLDGHGHTCMRE